MKAFVLAAFLLVPSMAVQGAEAVKAPAPLKVGPAATRGTVPPMGGNMGIGEFVPMGMVPSETFTLFLTARQAPGSGMQPETLKGTLALEVRIENEFMPLGGEESWFQIGTIDFSDLRTEPKVGRIMRKVECPQGAVEYRLRFLSCNLKPYYMPRVEVMGVVTY